MVRPKVRYGPAHSPPTQPVLMRGADGSPESTPSRGERADAKREEILERIRAARPASLGASDPTPAVVVREDDGPASPTSAIRCLSLEDDDRSKSVVKPKRRGRPRSSPVPVAASSASVAGPQTAQAPDEEFDLDTDGLITLALWNSAKMSPRSQRFITKCSVLERMVDDTPGLCVILLQEVCSGAAGEVARRLQVSSGQPAWTAVGCGSAGPKHRSDSHAHPPGVSCQAAVFDGSKVTCIGEAYATSRSGSMDLFVRSPHVTVFAKTPGPRESARKLLCVANCHVSLSEPRGELQKLPDLVDAMRTACARHIRSLNRTDVNVEHAATFAIAGDFNKSADSADFDLLRRSVEFEALVMPPRAARALVDHASGTAAATRKLSTNGEGEAEDDHSPAPIYLTTPTTSGGLYVDNLWLHRAVRANHLVDAWCYNPGGRDRSLRETSHASAGRLRSERSDHVPIVAKLRLPLLDGDDSAGPTGWTRAAAFDVHLP